MTTRPEIEPRITIGPEIEPHAAMRPEIEPDMTTMRPETEPHIAIRPEIEPQRTRPRQPPGNSADHVGLGLAGRSAGADRITNSRENG